MVTSDAATEEKVEFVAPLVAAPLAVPFYLFVVVPIEGFLGLGDTGRRLLRLGVAIMFGLALQEVAVRSGLIPRV